MLHANLKTGGGRDKQSGKGWEGKGVAEVWRRQKPKHNMVFDAPPHPTPPHPHHTPIHVATEYEEEVNKQKH